MKLDKWGDKRELVDLEEGDIIEVLRFSYEEHIETFVDIKNSYLPIRYEVLRIDSPSRVEIVSEISESRIYLKKKDKWRYIE